MSGSALSLLAKSLHCFCFSGLLVEGLDAPEDDPLSGVIIEGAVCPAPLLLEEAAALLSSHA